MSYDMKKNIYGNNRVPVGGKNASDDAETGRALLSHCSHLTLIDKFRAPQRQGPGTSVLPLASMGSSTGLNLSLTTQTLFGKCAD